MAIQERCSAGSQYNALGGNDVVTLPDVAKADAAGYDLTQAFHGGDGNDTITGGNGNDTIFVDAGNNTLIGGLGSDTMTGGSGNNTFVFNSILDSIVSAPDVITDFKHGSDHIDLSAIDANVNSDGQQTFAWGGQDTQTQANSVTWSESNNGNTIIHIDNSGDPNADMQIVLTGTNLHLSAGDFIL